MTTPNPASPDAVARGCTCDRSANRAGYGEPINAGANRRWYLATGCPVHNPSPEENDHV